MFLELQEPDFMFLAQTYSAGTRIFLKRFKQVFCGQNEEISCHHVTKIIT